VNPAEAATVLGVGPVATPDEIRSAYRRRLRASHPDVVDGVDANHRTAQIIQAYEVLKAAVAPLAPAVVPPVVTRMDEDTLAVAAPAEETFLLLLDAAYRLGEVTYVDVDAGLLEAVVDFGDGVIGSVVASLQGRGAATEVFLTVERLGKGPPVPAARLLDLVVSALGL